MKSTTKAFGIIWGVLASLAGIIMAIIGASLSGAKEEAIQSLMEAIPEMTLEQATASTETTIAVILVFGFTCFVPAIYSVVLATLVHNEKIGKVPGIVLGAVGIVLGALLPGVLFLIDSVQSRGLPPQEENPAPTESK